MSNGTDSLRTFECHGFEEAGRTGNEVYGSCPLCDVDTHFYLKVETGQWDCKKCVESGNVITFLEKVHERHLGDTTDRDYKRLAMQRGIPAKTLRRHELAWNGAEWLIPARGPTGRIHDLRRWYPSTGKIMSTTGCEVQLYGADVLAKAKPSIPVWLCEGEWDAMALGDVLRRRRRQDIVVAVPGAATFKKDWIAWFRNCDVRLAYDHDDAGRKGADKAVKLLSGVASSIHRVRWPNKKPVGFDVRDLVNGVAATNNMNIGKITLQRLAKWLQPVEVAAEGKHASGGSSDGLDPHFLADRILDTHHRHVSVTTLRFFKGQWWTWTDSHFRHLPNDEYRARTNRDLRVVLDEVSPSRHVTQNLVNNVMRAMEGICVVPGELELPAWLGAGPKPGRSDLLAMENGLLDIEGALDGEDDVLHDQTPDWFCLTRWEYEYDPVARCPRWRRFLTEVLPSQRQRRLLQEFIGYCLVFDTRYQKFLIVVGDGANGKSVVTTVITHVLGIDNVTSVPLEHFGDRFSLAPTIGKLANVVSEIGYVKHIAEDTLKSVVSGDLIPVEFKFQHPSRARPTVRLVFATNELPRFSDRSDGIWRRMLILTFDVTIPENKQDRDLANNICASELPGIFNWALAGLRRLRENDGFTVPKSTKAAIAMHRTAVNPARQFLEEKCVATERGSMSSGDLYRAYAVFCETRRVRPLGDMQFGKEVKRVFPDVERKQVRKDGKRSYRYVGVVMPTGRF